MYNSIFQLFLLLTILCLTALSLSGWGRFVYQFLDPAQRIQPFDFQPIWIGLFTILSLVELVHLFVPIDWKVTACLAILGLINFVYSLSKDSNKAERSISYRPFFKPYWLTACIFVVILIWSLRAMGVANNADSGLYHFASIKWINEYPLIPGLGNLHWRLALNQSYFGFLALMNFEPFWHQGAAAGGLFILLLTAGSFFQFLKIQCSLFRWIFGSILFIYFGYLAGTVSSPSPDTAVSLFEITIFIYLAKFIQKSEVKAESTLLDFVTILFICFAVITIKLSSVAFAASSALITIYCFIKKNRISLNLKLSVHISLILFLALSIHLFRGYLLSGMPIFPSWVGAAEDFRWAVPIEVAKFETNLIYSWARAPGDLNPAFVLKDWRWFSAWLNSLPVIAWIIFLTATGFTAINFTVIIFQRRFLKNWYVLYVPILSALFFWFFTAPDIRFLGVVPILYLALSIWIFFDTCKFDFLKKIQLTTLLVFKSFFFFTIVLTSIKLIGINSISLTGWQPPIRPELVVKQTDSGLNIYLPSDGFNCWEASTPCAPIFNGNLKKIDLQLPTTFGPKFYFSVK